jgi:hypothetical protein
VKRQRISSATRRDADAAPLPATMDHRWGDGACFIVRDANGQALGYFYFEDDPGRRTAAKLLTEDEARRIAVDSLRCPALLQS